ncbi:MAG: hypothetical protein JWM48_1893 [Mycobacterium sp.]|jgi:hypothetical protein|nr:hypothetical protein [Mycobacterium sp.]MCW2745343.1 hypothetical protein [Mycobacterium sp.]
MNTQVGPGPGADRQVAARVAPQSDIVREVAVPAQPLPVETAAEAPPGGLTDRERAVLDFERHWWQFAGAKEQAVRERFDMSATRYYQLLNALIDRPEALTADPMLVKRLRRLRSTRQRARAQRRLGTDG